MVIMIHNYGRIDPSFAVLRSEVCIYFYREDLKELTEAGTYNNTCIFVYYLHCKPHCPNQRGGIASDQVGGCAKSRRWLR